MAWKCTFNGANWTEYVSLPDAPSIGLRMNERSEASFTLLSTAPSIPVRYSEWVLYRQDGTTKLFGGLLNRRTLDPLESRGAPYNIQCELIDFSLYTDWYSVILEYTAATTPEAVVAAVVAQAPAAFGLTYTPVVTGFTLSPFSRSGVLASDILKDISSKTGLCFRFSPDKDITLFAPGGISAPYNITDSAPRSTRAVWSDSDKAPANKVVINLAVLIPTTETILGSEGVSSGGFTRYTTDYPCSQNIEDTWPNTMYVDGTPFGVVKWGLPDVTFALGWDYLNHRIVMDEARVTPPSGASVLSVGYSVASVIVIGAGSPVIEARLSLSTAVTLAEAVEIATQALAQLNQQPRAVTIESVDAGWLPGQISTITLAARDLSAAVVLFETVDITLSEGAWRYTMTGLENQSYQGSYQDQWRALTSGNGNTGAVTVVMGVAGATVGAVVMVPLAFDPDKGVTTAAGAWVAPSTLQVRIDSTKTAGLTLRVRAHINAQTAGRKVTARMYNVTDSAAAGMSAQVTATTPTEVVFYITVAIGVKYYRLELSPDATGEYVYGIGMLENV